MRWRTDGPARDAYFFVYGTRTREPETDRDASIGTAAGGTRRRSFHVRLRDAAHVRYVHRGRAPVRSAAHRGACACGFSDRWRA